MANIKGTNVAAPVVPFTEQDLFPTHEAKYGKGGYRTVETLDEMYEIPDPRKEEGMLVYVKEDPSGIHTYQLINGNWVRNTIGRGFPIYNNDLIEAYGIDPAVDKYISIPDEDDLIGETEEQTIRTSINGTYIDIIMQSLRQLQAEVARLRNTMRYGMESYTDSVTAMSTTLDDLENAIAEEPIWAIDENALSLINGFDFELGDSGANELKGGEVEVAINPSTGNSYLKISGTSTWESGKDIRKVGDSKLYVYTTLLSLKETLKLDEISANGDPKEDGTEVSIDLSSLKLSYTSEKNLYNVIVIISRKDDKERGDNFIWINISDPYSDRTCVEGYYNPETEEISEAQVNLDKRYTVMSVDYTDTTLYKFKMYSKMQDFSHSIIASKPDEEDYKYKVAHITIRSVENQKVLNSIKDQLLENELIWEKSNKRLWIKSDYKLVPVGNQSSSSGDDPVGPGGDNMTQEELIAALKEMGIVAEKPTSDGDYELSLNNIADITFIHQGSNKKFKFEVTSNGDLQGQEVANDGSLLGNRLKSKENNILADGDIRGFIGQLHGVEAGLAGNSTTKASDYGLSADRLKIAAFYAPLVTDKVHGCSHCYVELENTSNKDIPLTGCYLHFTRPKGNTDNNRQDVFHLPLTGIIKAGSTYLIRGAKCAEFDDPNVYLKVKTFDQEWWDNGSLVSFEINNTQTAQFITSSGCGYGFALTYGNEELKAETTLITATTPQQVIGNITVDTATYPFKYDLSFIDAIYYYKACQDKDGKGIWAKNNTVGIKSNSIYKNTFELDPAKQAFQGLNKKDCSRERWSSVNDYQVVDLTNEFITFPNSKYKYAISNYTPKASFENRNVSTDKTKLDKERPNMVTCAFGIDMYKTRAFNWISLGYYDEYLWIRPIGEDGWTKKYQSYIPYQKAVIESITAVENSTGGSSYEIAISVKTTGWEDTASLEDYTVLTDQTHKKVASGAKFERKSTGGTNVYVATVSDKGSLAEDNIVYIHQANDALDEKKYFDSDINNNIYARMTGRFPGDGSFYTAHKAIVDVVEENVEALTTYEYIVGRPDKNGNPDLEHCSEIQKFTLYPTNYKTRIYQVTDQQGFTWIEYQAWAAAAEALNNKIKEDQSKESIIPILINTGDMTQNGTRINEWYDYYTAGYCLFNHLEQMNIVGNNDLCGSDPEVLGTGDDPGKSNSFYFHLFYCYEINPKVFIPLVREVSGNNISGVPKYIPSLYYFDSSTDRFLAVNSEITETTCKTWYKLMSSDSKVINLYTGYSINGHNGEYCADGWTTVYTMIYKILENAGSKKPVTVYCHEMPFTVITSDSLSKTQEGVSRSISPAGALVGSHLNQISKNEVGNGQKTPKGIYWFTRLLENFNVKLVLGGHKHTYACTYPLRENYLYSNSEGVQMKSKDGKMPMQETLKEDSINLYTIGGKDLSKIPLAKRANPNMDSSTTKFYPVEGVPGLTGGIVYFMCQATGYKQTSNKELPSPDQEFSSIVSKTSSEGKPSADQKYPMFGVIDVANGDYSIKLARVTNIMKGGVFNQSTYGTGEPGLEWMVPSTENKFGKWNRETPGDLFIK